MADKVKAIWRTADCVCLDVDSTVVVDEGIDELADFVGKGKEVAAM
jgi:phosphoserine phosphatase